MVSGALQVYQAERPDQKIKVFHLVYEDSFEADKFMAGVDREASTALHHSACNAWPATRCSRHAQLQMHIISWERHAWAAPGDVTGDCCPASCSTPACLQRQVLPFQLSVAMSHGLLGCTWLTDCHFLRKVALPCMPCLACSCEASYSFAIALPLSTLTLLQRNVFADIIKRKEVMALPNLAEDLAYVSLLCVLGEDNCSARSLLHVCIGFWQKACVYWVLSGPCRLALQGGSP